MVKLYKKGEFVVDGLEVIRAKVSEEYINDDTCFGGYILEELDIYKNGEQIDIEDESEMSEALWDKISELIEKQIVEEESIADFEYENQ